MAPWTATMKWRLPHFLAGSLLLVCLTSCADIFLAINPPGSEGELCSGLFVTEENFELCRRRSDGALGAFDVFIEDLVVAEDGRLLLAGDVFVGQAEVTQSFDVGDSLGDVFWQLKNTDNTLLSLDDIASNTDVILAMLAGDGNVADALDFIADFSRFYLLNFNSRLAADSELIYGIDLFFACAGTTPSERDLLCGELYDLDRNGTLDAEDYVDLIAVVESPEAAESVFPSAVFSGATLSTYYNCAQQTFTQDNPITGECALLDLDRNDVIDETDLRLLFDSGEESNNSPPAAIAGVDQTVTAGDTVTLDGTDSLDLETVAGSLRFSWEQIGGPSVALTDPSSERTQLVTPDVSENTDLEFSLTVTDTGGLFDSDKIIITVQPTGPIAAAGTDQQVSGGALVTLDGSGSSGTDLTFTWNQVAGPDATLSSTSTQKPVFTAPTASTATVVTFQLVVEDTNGLQDSDTVDVTILPSDASTTASANAGADQQVDEGALTTLDGTASEGTSLTYSWEQLSGTTVALSSTDTAQPVFVAPQVTTPETLRFRVTVQDVDGNSDTDEVDITVLDSGP